jgi:hypothetical protein
MILNLQMVKIIRVGFILAGVALGSLACGGGKSPTGPTPTAPLPTEFPSPTSVPATSTPVPLMFTHYDVFAADAEGGGKVVFVMLADGPGATFGKVVFISAKPVPACENGAYLYVHTVALGYTNDGFRGNIGPFGVMLEGRLLDAQTLSVKMSVQEQRQVNTSNGVTNCPGGSVAITAARVGNGKEKFLESYRLALREYSPGASSRTDQQLVDQISQSARITLP